MTANGPTTIDYWSVDVAGNAETPKTATIKVDTGGPVSSISGIPAGWTASDVTFSLSASSERSTINGTFFKLGSGTSTPYSGPVTVSAEGVTTVTYYSTDAAGGTETARTADIRIDKSPPVSSLDGVTEGAVSAGPVTFSIQAADSFSGVASIRYKLNGGAEQVYSAPVTVSTPGATTVLWWAVDNAGNAEAPNSRSFSISGSAAKLPTSLTIRSSAGSCAIGRQFILFGQASVIGGSSAGLVGKMMHVNVKKPGKGYWTYSSNRIMYASGGKTLWQYKYTLKRGMARGIYSYQAVYGGSPDYKSSISSTVKVSVK